MKNVYANQWPNEMCNKCDYSIVGYEHEMEKKKTTRPDLLKVQIIEKVLTHCMIVPHSLLWTINVKQWPRLVLIAMKWPIVKRGICLQNNNVGKKRAEKVKILFLELPSGQSKLVLCKFMKGNFVLQNIINKFRSVAVSQFQKSLITFPRKFLNIQRNPSKLTIMGEQINIIVWF